MITIAFVKSDFRLCQKDDIKTQIITLSDIRLSGFHCTIKMVLLVLYSPFAVFHQIAEFGLCGNGVVDQGEDCDCGSQEECANTDPCCDPVSCRLKREAECSTGPCCDNCKVA
jgi:hypothetical protein